MDSLNLETTEIVRLAIIAVALFAALGLFRLVFKTTKRLLTIGCLGILIILAVLVVLAVLG